VNAVSGFACVSEAMVKIASNRCLQAAEKTLASVNGKKMLLPQELFLGSCHSPGRGAGGEECII
jgi:hypothetical protein